MLKESPNAGRRLEFAGTLAVLFAVRWAAWAIASMRIVFGDLPEDQTRHEPLLLVVTFAQSLVTALYAPFLRSRLPARVGARLARGQDLVALGLMDVALVMGVLYFAGGFQNPYEEYIYASLLVPAFVLSRLGAALLLATFLASLYAVFALREGGFDGPWFHGSFSRFLALFLVPVLVVVVVQYLSELSLRLREQREQALAALAENERLQQERERLAALEERGRIAREIHDGIAQSIYMLALNLDKAAEVAGEDASMSSRLSPLVSLAREVLLEVRYYIFDLKPLLSGEASLSATVQAQAREFTGVTGLDVQVAVDGEEAPLPVSVSASLYRVLQEALANIYRHASAGSVSIGLTYQKDRLCLRVADDGRGFLPTASESGRGLISMSERVERVGGRLEVRSAPGQGAILDVTIPLEQANDD